MPAICLLCVHGAATIDSPGDPLAACAICGAFCCNGHGKRDPDVRRFQCLLCVPALLVASATNLSVPATMGFDDRYDTPASSDRAAIEAPFLVSSVEEFLGRWPEFQELTGAHQQLSMRAEAEPPVEGEVWRSFSQPGQQLMLMAVAVARSLRLRNGDLPSRLVSLMRELRP